MTANRVLRRADVPVAGRALGIELPESVRSAADVPALHWRWTAALGAGLISIEGGRAVVAPALAVRQPRRAARALGPRFRGGPDQPVRR
ncbi:hypothetical protein [Saccharopolyspora pogona]|uniref:hypothetical protein n=1 Tax=Saccharopolyspora pogona TaxID=333966 RepID=UPI001CC23485|nr:hypothetical protein [Saccharopolyspora pogona]